MKTHIKVEYDKDVKTEHEEIHEEKESAFKIPGVKKEAEKVKSSSLKRKGKEVQDIEVKKEKSEEKVSNWEPENWKELLQNIKAMRKDESAPVDSQGCERTADETETPEVRFCHSLQVMFMASFFVENFYMFFIRVSIVNVFVTFINETFKLNLLTAYMTYAPAWCRFDSSMWPLQYLIFY